ncbi:MAG TPA: peptidoglycan DD-metalloendopeptidase family protein [Alcanivoracaceae bacterium]|nr:peptidoglycan DD-metalloendopeptidase family protein [Alcanivoracaceae bacterium]
MKPVKILLVLLLALGAWSCSTGNIPVYDYQTKSKSAKGGIGAKGGRSTGSHTVREGETLYSIAWRYGWDYRQLARANNIGLPYTIYPGQKIRFDGKAAAAPVVATRPAPKRTPQQPSRPAATPTPKASAPTKTSPPVAPAKPSITSDVAWHWPVPGQVVQRFSTSKDRRGLLLAGKQGDPVYAAAAGTVVYRGSGLTGYGNLLIIKHNDRWLSAYGHNDTLLVKEGQQVKARERIATMGATGTSSVGLHFEVRRDGQAVNPEQVLPRR